MGGVKKKSLGSSDKAVSGPGQEEKKLDSKKAAIKQVQKQKSTVLMDEGQAMKAIRTLKSITSQTLARTTGVKVSVANAFLRSLETKGILTFIGGYSGHRIYEVVSKATGVS
jgi:small subunit ribosomal protein S25e